MSHDSIVKCVVLGRAQGLLALMLGCRDLLIHLCCWPWAILEILFQVYHRANNVVLNCSPPGTLSSEENLLETYECQLKILHAVLTASGDQERDQLLTDHPGDICSLVHSVIEKVELESSLYSQPFLFVLWMEYITLQVHVASCRHSRTASILIPDYVSGLYIMKLSASINKMCFSITA